MQGKTDSERLVAIETTVRRIDLNLFGADGNEGKLGIFDKRITKLENWRWWVMGVAVGAGGIIGGLIGKAIAVVGVHP
jgi:hypothetical protein